jgi:hypothetical protein
MGKILADQGVMISEYISFNTFCATKLQKPWPELETASSSLD